MNMLGVDHLSGPATICLVHTVYSSQRLRIRVGQIEISLDRGFVKPRINRGYYTAARRYEFYFRVVKNNILRTSAASE